MYVNEKQRQKEKKITNRKKDYVHCIGIASEEESDRVQEEFTSSQMQK